MSFDTNMAYIEEDGTPSITHGTITTPPLNTLTAGEVHANAIMDRIAHDAVWLGIGKTNIRRRREAGR